MNAVFADTSAWLAAQNPRLEDHEETLGQLAAFEKDGIRIITTGFVVAEMHAMLLRRQGPAAALEFLDGVDADPSCDVVDVDGELVSAATDRWLRVFRDHPFSLCDAVSFEVMRREGIRQAFTLDHHFAVAGFAMVPAPRRPPQRRR